MPWPLWLAKLLIRTGVAQHSREVRRLMGEDVGLLELLSDRVLTSPATEAKCLQSVFDRTGDSAVDLSLGAPPESCFRLDPREAAELFDHSFCYPLGQGLPELREAVAAKLAADNGLDVDPQREVLVTNGASQAADLVIEALVNRGDRVVLLAPAYLGHRFMLATRGARTIYVPTEVVDGSTTFDERTLAAALRGAKLLVLNSPSNPTGGMLSAELLDRIAYWVRRRRTVVLSDEVYERFVYEGRHISPATIPSIRARTLTVNSVSKSYGLAGLRVGYLTGAPTLVETIMCLQVCGTPFVPDACQRLAARALAQPPAAFAPILELYTKRRHVVAERLRAMGLDAAPPAGAFYFFPSLASLGIGGEEAASRLAGRFGVVVVPGHLFGPGAEGHIRISYAVDSDRLDEGLKRIEAFVRSR